MTTWKLLDDYYNMVVELTIPNNEVPDVTFLKKCNPKQKFKRKQNVKQSMNGK